jgi:hypothetical protein
MYTSPPGNARGFVDWKVCLIYKDNDAEIETIQTKLYNMKFFNL